MNIYLQVLMAFLLGATLILYFHWRRKAEKLQGDRFEMENLIEEQGIALKEMLKATKKYKHGQFKKEEAHNLISSLKRINRELEIENFTLKQKPLFKIGEKIHTSDEIIDIQPQRVPVIERLKYYSEHSINVKYQYIYTVKTFPGLKYEIFERDIPPKLTPEPNKEEIFSVESFE